MEDNKSLEEQKAEFSKAFYEEQKNRQAEFEANRYDTSNIEMPEPKPEISGERPSWLPEKFKSSEEMAKAYSELEKKLGVSEPSPEVQEPAVQESESEVEQEPVSEETQDVVPEEKLPFDLKKFESEYLTKGELSEESYKELSEKHNLPKEIVEDYIRSKNAVAQSQIDKFHGIVGGIEKYNELMLWAKDNISKEDAQAYNKIIASQTNTMEEKNFALSSLAARRGMPKVEEASDPIIKGKALAKTIPIFKSKESLRAAMDDPRFDSDPAYKRKVMEVYMNSVKRK